MALIISGMCGLLAPGVINVLQSTLMAPGEKVLPTLGPPHLAQCGWYGWMDDAPTVLANSRAFWGSGRQEE